MLSPSPPRRRWWSALPPPPLEPIGARRAYAEVLGVFLAFFASGIVGAALLLGGREHSLRSDGSWALYCTQTVEVLSQVGLAVAVALLLGARRGVGTSTLGLGVARRPDGRPALSVSVRICGWAFLALVAGGILNALLQSGHLPEAQPSAPELIFGVADSLQAGVIEELLVLAFVVVTLRQAGRPLWEVTAVALVLRGSYHIYYGPGVAGILVWAALYYWLYLRFRQLLPLMVCHAVWDAVQFLGQRWHAVFGVAVLAVACLWLACLVLWLSERADRRRARPAPTLWLPPPGWHPDPTGANRWRWWDGQQWTGHVSHQDAG